MERLEFDLLFRWFVGIGVDDAAWDHSTFSKNRERLLEGDIIDEGDAFLQLFEHGVFDDFGVDQLFQLQLVERQHADHLHQARRQNLTLRYLQA